jgi:hypothetical protein
MERRDAIRALLALPQVARIVAATVKPTDVIVVECDRPLTRENIERLRALVKDAWPGHAMMICDAGVRVKVVES